MKKLSYLVATLSVAMCTAVSAFAQDSTKQLFHLPAITTVGLYVAPEFGYGQLKDGMTSFGGGSVMVLFNKTFAIGVTGQRSLNPNYSPSSLSPLYLHGAYGGLKMEYTIKPNSIIHCNVNFMAGVGATRLDSTTTNWNRDRNDMRRGSQMFDRGEMSNFVVLQPGLQIEANLFKYVKMFAGASYRFAIEGNHTSSKLPTSSMQGFSASGGLKIGLFDYQIHKKEAEQK